MMSDGHHSLRGEEPTRNAIVNDKINRDRLTYRDFIVYLSESVNSAFDQQLHPFDSVRSMPHVANESTFPLLVTNALVGGPMENVTGSSDDYHYESSLPDVYHNRSGDEVSGTFSSPYLMPWPQRSAWITVFAMMLVVATVGNTLVAWIVLAHRRMKTVTNYFLVNLSLADLTMSLFNCIFNFTFMLNSHWPFGGFYCTVSNFIANVTVAASVFTLVAISFDRYIAIVHPLRPRMSKCIARIAISIIWLASCILAIPCLLYSQTISHSYPDGEIRVVCIVVWPDGLPSESQQDFIYNIVFTVLTYLIPVSVMGVCYSRMSYILWRSQSIGELNQRQAESIQSKRKVVRMFIVVVMLFAVCWLPYHGYFVYQFIDHQVISYKYVQHIFLSFYWLAMSNAMINPLVYYYMNARFRQYFKTVICQCMCYRGRSSSACGVTDLAAAAIRLGNTGGRRSSADRSLPPGPYINHRVLRTRRCNSQAAQLNGTSGGAVSTVRQADHSSSSQNNSRHSVQHEGHQRCLVFAKASEPQAANHHHQQPFLMESGSGVMASNGSHSIHWTRSRHHMISAWLPALVSSSSLHETCNSLARYQTYRRSASDYNKDTLLADTKI